MSRRAGWRRFSSEPFELGQPDVDEGRDALLEPGFARDHERLLVARAHPGGVEAPLQIVARDEESVDSLIRVVPLHIRTVSVQI